MNNQESGSIINMEEIVGNHCGPSLPHYSAAKAGILGFTEQLQENLHLEIFELTQLHQDI